MKEYKRYLVTSALPYANGPVHIGHLAGVYVPSDIYVRYLRKRGRDVIWVCGSDEHGVPITIKARREGISPQDVVDKYHKIIKESFEGLGISFDIYSRTTSPVHAKTASDFFLDLYNKGEFTEETTDAVSTTRRPASSSPTATSPANLSQVPAAKEPTATSAKSAAASLNATDLINPRSRPFRVPQPVLRETKHWYLPLDRARGVSAPLDTRRTQGVEDQRLRPVQERGSTGDSSPAP